MNSKNSTSTSQSTTQQRDPYAAAQPGLNATGKGVTDWLNSPMAAQAWTGPRVAQQSDRTAAGLGEMFNSTGAKQAEGYLKGVVGGDYLGQANPYLSQLQDATRASVMPSINSRVSASGMAPGSSVDQSLVSREMTRAMAQPLFQTYENERNRQQQAAGMLPGVSQGIIGNMIGAGQMGEGYDQRNIDAARQAAEEQRTAGLRPYAEAMPILSRVGQAGGTSTGTTSGTQTQQTRPGMGQQILGAGMMGASLFGTGGLFGGGGSIFGSPANWFGGSGGGGNDPGGSYQQMPDGSYRRV